VGDPQASSISAAHHEVQATQKTALSDRCTKGVNQAEPTHLDMTDPFAKKDGGHTDPLKSKLQSGDGTAASISGMADGKPEGDSSKEKNGSSKNGPPENVGANKQHGGNVDSENKPAGPNGGDGGINPGSAQKAKDANAAQQADAPVRKEK
jgi:hypothetical protein